MSSCLSGGGRSYGFDLEIVKSPSTSSTTSHSSSPSSTLSESSNSPIAISTRKPRTPRKRPNQTYNEAAALLSTAYPNIFSTKHLTKPCKFTKLQNTLFNESPVLLLPFRAIDNSGFLLHHPILEKPSFVIEQKFVNSCDKPCQSPVENEFQVNALNLCDGYNYQEDFDAESILDEEIEEGMDSIMGNLSVNDSVDELASSSYSGHINTCYGYPMELGFSRSFDFGFGVRRGVKALRNVDEGDWWRFPTSTVDVVDITPKFKKISVQKKKKNKVGKAAELKSSESVQGNSIPKAAEEDSIPIPESNCGLRLKLNYEEVSNAWSDRGSPFPDEILGAESSGNDIHAGSGRLTLRLRRVERGQRVALQGKEAYAPLL